MLLDPSQGPFYLQIYHQLRTEIETGRRAAGTRLPSKRALAAQLGVSVNTVDGAYSQLLSEGFLEARPRSGYYVCPMDTLQRLSQPEKAEPSAPLPAQDAVEVDFAPGGVDREKFPHTVWRRLLKSTWNEYDPSLLRSTPSQGDPGLRQAVARYLRDARGVRTDAEHLVIGAGTDHLLMLLSFLLDSSCTLAVENPVYNKAHLLFARMGHPVLPVPIDHQGVSAAQLEDLDDLVLYTTPSHQFPLGISIPMGRRVKLLNWCGAGRFRYIIEDDYDSEFRYDTRPLPSLQSIDRNDRVIYLGSFSGCLTPSLRMAYMVLPDPLLALYRRRCAVFSSAVSAFEQAVLREFLDQGYFETHLNRMRVQYKNKRQRLLDGLAPLGDRLQIIGEAAGHRLTVRHLGGLTEQELCRRALDHGVCVYPISPYFIGPMDPKYDGKVLLGFGGLTERQLDRGAALLCTAWQTP
jgi:GntR family transcriptional regulator/MocR family aminotransferase